MALACLFRTGFAAHLDDADLVRFKNLPPPLRLELLLFCCCLGQVDDHAADIHTHARWAHEVYGTTPAAEDVESVVRTLEEMAALFEREVRWIDGGGSGGDDDSMGDLVACALYRGGGETSLASYATTEESLWLQRQLELFSDTFRSISYGEETLRAGIRYHQVRKARLPIGPYGWRL